VESALRLDQPLRLDRLGLMLRVIRAEFADYKLTKVSATHIQFQVRYLALMRNGAQENCWAMTSVILELLEAEGQGTYLHGRLCFPEWAPEVRKRVRDEFASVSCTSRSVQLIVSVPTGSVVAVPRHSLRADSLPKSQTIEMDGLASRIGDFTCVSLDTHSRCD
jgi:hypothetical protein